MGLVTYVELKAAIGSFKKNRVEISEIDSNWLFYKNIVKGEPVLLPFNVKLFAENERKIATKYESLSKKKHILDTYFALACCMVEQMSMIYEGLHYKTF